LHRVLTIFFVLATL